MVIYLSTVRTIVKNIGALSVMNILSSILMLVLTVHIARFLGDAEFGRYSFAFAFTYIFAIFADFGMNHLLIKDIARQKNNARKYMNNVLVIKIILALLIFLLIVLTLNLLGYPHETKVIVYIVGAYTILTSFAQMFKSLFCAFEKMEYESLITIIEKLILVLAGLTVLYLGYGLFELVLVYLFAGLVNVALSAITANIKFTKVRFDFDFDLWKHLMINAIPLGLTIIFISIYEKIDIVMLSVMKDNATVGWYGASYTLTAALIFIPATLLNAIYPAFSRFYISSFNTFTVLYKRSFGYLFLIVFPIAVGTTLLADKIILLVYGHDFSYSVPALKILIWSCVFNFMSLLLIFVLQSMDKQKIFVYATGSCALLNVILNFLLIPEMSYIGASVATVITQIVLFTLLFYNISVYVRTNLFNTVARSVISGIVMGVGIVYIKDFVGFFGVVLLAIITYFVVLIAIGGISKEDMKLIKNIVGR